MQRNSPKNGDWIEERLRSEKPVHEAPAGLVGRVIANLPAHTTRDAMVAPRRPVFWPRVALGFGAVMIAAVLTFEFLRPEVEQPQLISNARVQEAKAEALQIAMPQITSEQVQELTLKLDEPLEKELQNVISDTRQAIQFVAANFLPEK